MIYKNSALLIAATIILLSPFVFAGQVFYVDGDAPGPVHDGTSWESAFRYIGYAKRAAHNGDDIHIAQGTYKPDQDRTYPDGSGNRNYAFGLRNYCRVMGGFAGYGESDPDARDVEKFPTILSGDLEGNDGPGFGNRADNSYHVIASEGNSETAILDGVIITGGCADGEGLKRYGGGLYMEGSNPVIRNCTFVRNLAVEGGGIVCRRESSPRIENCRFLGNRSFASGGGLNALGGSGTPGEGPVVANCVFSGNTGGGGGGASVGVGCSILIANCTFYANSGEAIGGGLLLTHEPAKTVVNTIFWKNLAPVGNDISLYGDVELVESHNLYADPGFADPSGFDGISGTLDDDLHLLAGSPAIDAGDNASLPAGLTTDLDGEPRIVNGQVDIGAYEGGRQGIIIEPVELTVPEGQAGKFVVRLASAPTEPVEVTVQFGSGDSDIVITSAITSFLFDASNYGDAREVDIAANQDLDLTNGRAFIHVIASGLTPRSVLVTEADHDSPPSLLHVDSQASGSNTGTSWNDAFNDLQTALGIAAEHAEVEEIRVAQGTYRPAPPDGERTVAFQLRNSLSLKGGYGGTSMQDPDERNIDTYTTILSGDLHGDDGNDFENYADNSFHVIVVPDTSGSVLLEGFVIQGGNAPLSGKKTSSGGGVYMDGSILMIRHCIFRHNIARDDGGAVFFSHGGLTLEHCQFEKNKCTHSSSGGGALGGVPENTIICRNCSFTGNTSQDSGGAFSMVGYSGQFYACVFRGNSAAGKGGAGINHMSDVVFSNCLFAENTAGEGGAVYNKSLTGPHIEPQFVNCTFSNNQSSSGGAITDDKSNSTLTNCILWNNSGDGTADEAAQVSIVAGTPTISYCCIQGWTGLFGGEGNTGDDPFFVDLAAGDYRLFPGSAAIDMGTNTPDQGLPEFDLDTTARIKDGNSDGEFYVDMGVYEAETVDGPVIDVSFSEYVFKAHVDYSESQIATLGVSNWGIGSLDWSVESDCSWLQIAAAGDEVTLTMNSAGLEPGDYTCTVDIVDSGALNSPRTVTVMLVLRSALYVGDTHTTIQDAVDAAVDGDIIMLPDGVYTGPGNSSPTVTNKELTIIGQNGPANCIIDFQGTGSGLTIDDDEGKDVVIDGLTIRNAHTGILCISKGNAVIRNCVIQNCHEGIWCVEPCVVMSNCHIMQSGTYGIVIESSSTPTITNCLVTESGYSGLSLRTDGALVSNCLATSNGFEGIWYEQWPSSENKCELRYCTIADNEGFGIGGVGPREVMVDNSIVWGNMGDKQINTDTDASYTVAYSNVEHGFDGEGNMNETPWFVDPANGDYRLLGISPCINRGDPDYVAAEGDVDIDGVRRVIYGRVDMGAYETASADSVRDGEINMHDLASLASNWSAQGCAEPGWCGWADLTLDGIVDFDDLAQFAGEWALTRFGQVPVAYLRFDETTGDVAADSSLFGRDGTLKNMDDSDWVAGTVGNALDFDGVDDFVEISGFAGLLGGQSRTVCAWIKTDTPGRVIIAWGPNGVPGGRWVFSTTAAGQLRVGVGGGFIEGTADVCDGAWHHAAVVMENDGSPNINEVRLYVDGLPDEPGWNASNRVINTQAASNVSIGQSLGALFFKGTIDEIRIYDRPLSKEEIAALAL